jgi:HAD superfamily hydrolase (TIGR01490 family)
VSRPAVVVAFDLDGTLTVRDAVMPFFRKVGGTRKLLVESLRNLPALVSAFAKRDRDTAKEIAAGAIFRGVQQKVLEEQGQLMARRIAGSWLREDVLARLRWHQEQGHYIVIVSASFGAYVGPLGSRLGVNQVIATELLFDVVGICTGELAGGNCRGEEKARRLKNHLDESFATWELCWAYGDSSGDTAMLAMAENSVNVARLNLTPCAENLVA